MDKHDSFPRLYGAPGNVRPPKPVQDTDRPPNPDDLPLEFDRTRADRRLADELAPRPYRYASRPTSPERIEEDEGELRPASVGLRGLADRFLRERSARPLPEFRKPPGRGVRSGPAGE
ncbi:MAG: hypothetical protein FJ038_02230 [Chloroflexi bacterium]|nr:hypothetical protein [Chloroflexota bacterium]